MPDLTTLLAKFLEALYAGSVTVTGTFAAATVTASASMRVGGTPATAGAWRTTNGQGMFSRNSANSADRLMIGYGTSIADTISIGQAGVDVSMPGGVGIGATPGADGNCNAASFSVAGTAGASFGPGVVTSLTCVNGIITAVS